GMYPIVVILLINKKRSEIETFGFSAALKAHGALDVELQEVPPAVTSQYVESQPEHGAIIVEARETPASPA
ncbi:hypothetical protein H0H87_012194, partial [Tephrocybe sp. NHM501043]